VFVFVYGTLKRGEALHGHLAGQRFVECARTVADYRLYRLDWFPGLVETSSPDEGVAIHGELWDVDEATLGVLDVVEEVGSGLYERRLIRLQAPFDRNEVIAYFYRGDVQGCSDNGDRW
jgi:gamma-glutamylaminecyclotransferase